MPLLITTLAVLDKNFVLVTWALRWGPDVYLSYAIKKSTHCNPIELYSTYLSFLAFFFKSK